MPAEVYTVGFSVAYFLLVWNLYLLAVYCYNTCEVVEYDDEDYPQLMEMKEYALRLSVMNVMRTAIYITTIGLLIHGIRKKQASLLKPFLVFNAFYISLWVFYGLVLVVQNFLSMLEFILFSGCIAIDMAIFYLMYQIYQEIKLGNYSDN